MVQEYLHWDRKMVSDLSDDDVAEMYDRGYVFTRLGRGVMDQSRSFRIRLAEFELSSENRRIMRKVENMKLETSAIPYAGYSWEIGKMAKDFYASREAQFSANKIKELLTSSGGEAGPGNFNLLLRYIISDITIGFAICYSAPTLLHYSYPFYDLAASSKDTGLGMMLLAIQYAKEKGLKYIYLGSLQRPSDTYKLQFKGMEWFDGKRWQTDPVLAKEALK